MNILSLSLHVEDSEESEMDDKLPSDMSSRREERVAVSAVAVWLCGCFFVLHLCESYTRLKSIEMPENS